VIYLDHHASTPLTPAAARAMDAARDLAWANPSSIHTAGRRARALLEDARRSIADAVRVDAADLVLTSGGTESVNLAMLGLGARAQHIVTTDIEHPALSESVARLEAAGAHVTRLGVPGGVAPSIEALSGALDVSAARESTLVALQ
jgi:cysteine desulfurase